MQVYTRLQKLGVCLSHTATLTALKKMGLNHDQVIKNWTRQMSTKITEDEDDEELVPDPLNDDNPVPPDKSVSIILDNLDKNVNPRNMTVNNQTQTFHYCQAVAVVTRIKTLHLKDKEPVADLSNIPVASFLPSVPDCATISNNFVILASRVIVENFSVFFYLKKCVPAHIKHKYSKSMNEKSVSVSHNYTCIIN